MTTKEKDFYCDSIGIDYNLTAMILEIETLGGIMVSYDPIEDGNYDREEIERAMGGIKTLQAFFDAICDECFDISKQKTDLERLEVIFTDHLEAMTESV